MRLLDRYILRQLWPPFWYAFAAMTSLMLLNQVARRFGDLVGKGLPWSVIGEVFWLCLPFIVAMTLPMAVLLAVLYSISHLAADNEITAMRANGVSVGQVVAPLLLASTLLAVVNFAFTDQVLPKSNARLRNLLINIQRKKPTLEMREQVINEIPQAGFFLRASRIDPPSGRLRNVTIFDLAPNKGRRIIYADSGRMAMAPGGADLSLRLYSGSIQEFKVDQAEVQQLTYFTIDDIRVRDVANHLELSMADDVRGDREMTTCEMLGVVHEAERDIATSDQRREDLVRRDLRFILGLAPPPPAGTLPAPRLSGYCLLFHHLERVFFPNAAQAQATPPVRVPPAQSPGLGPGSTLHLSTWGEVASARDNERGAGLRSHQYSVEVHKKWAISAACIVFVIVGVPMALRFPRGGVGLVLGGGLSVFALNYVGLIAGESLGDEGFISPWLAMWGPNLILLVLGSIGLYRVSRESGSTRGGDFAEIIDALTSRFTRRRA